MIFNFMKNHASMYPARKMAKVLGVSRAGYYKYIRCKKSATICKNEDLLIKIKVISKKSRYNYGSPRIHAALKQQGELCSRKRIAKIMKKNGVQAKTKKRWKASAKGKRDLSCIAPNLLQQNFKVAAVNLVWVMDITYVSTKEGWLYVSTVLDLYSRKIVGLSMSNRADTALVLKSLHQAVTHRQPSKGLIIHSDRGCQYTSGAYIDYAKTSGFTVSMSSKGNCYDNAAMETFFHTLKTEHVYFCNYLTRKEAISSIFEYIEVFYNRERLHSSLNYMSPCDFELQHKAFSHQNVMSRVELARPAIEVMESRI
jgi:putative transposase